MTKWMRGAGAGLLAGGTLLAGGCVAYGPGPDGYYDYDYYPGYDVYFYPQAGIYYWNEGGHWHHDRRWRGD